MRNKLAENVYQFYFPKFGSCVYLLRIGKDNILIDTSSKENQEDLLNELEKSRVNPRDVHMILLTHKHWDHTGNLELFPNAKVYSSENVNDINLIMIRTIKTSGHTKDSICFIYKEILFSGDTLFHNGIGRTDLPESSPSEMQNSLDKLNKIDYKILAPGHV